MIRLDDVPVARQRIPERREAGAEEKETEQKEEEKKKTSPRSVMKEILYNSLFLLFVLIITLLLVKYVAQRTTVSGSSMEPMIHDGDSLIVDKITYRFRDPERFDIIVFPFEYQQDTYYIKRIIGLPGESVRIDENGNIYINGEILVENYGAEVIDDPGNAYNEIILGEGQYFVLGDNRNNSSDSRNPAVGLIHRDRIVGRAWLRIFPFDSFGLIRHQ
ncbi:MAG: signal peptidase I [Lachnospiraceae bacterium]|nr:signal peptidase I [Lachnospiraceae bacterium]